MIAASRHGRRGCDLAELIASADAYNHDIPTEAIVRRSVGRLVASGLLTIADKRMRLSRDGRALARQAKGGMFERAPSLLRLLQRHPLREGEWDLPSGAWQEAYERYRTKMAKYL